MNINKDKVAYTIINIVSAIVFAGLCWLIYFNTGNSTTSLRFVSKLPAVNALLNFTTTLLIVFGIRAIKKEQKEKHIRFMLSAVFTSALFLISYVFYHYFHGDTKFLAQGVIRPIYFFILISHIILSAVLVPFLFITLYHAFTKSYKMHKKFARITYPIWLYVSVTGVLIFFFIKIFN